MFRTAKLGTVAACLIVLNLLVATFNSTKANAAPNDPPKPVIVTNTPLPVSGSLTIGSLPNVTIANTFSACQRNRRPQRPGQHHRPGERLHLQPARRHQRPRLQQQSDSSPGRAARARRAASALPAPSGFCSLCDFSAVPSGKRLVI